MTRTETRRFLKLTIGKELRTQLVTSMNERRGPANDNRDFEPVVRKGHSIKPIKVGVGDKGYDDEDNHELLRDELGHIDHACEGSGRLRLEDEKALQEGDEEGVFEEGLPPEVKGRDLLLCRQEDHRGRGEVSQDKGAEQ